MESTKIDIAIIGGGIIGLWCAYEILKQKKDLTLVVFEKESYLGEHTTGRNSEVLHAGIYYKNNSLKHKLCIEGNRLWREFSKTNHLPLLDCGKFIVSNKTPDKLDRILSQAIQNEVPKIRRATSREMAELKDIVAADEALISETSAVLDTSSSLKCLEGLIERSNGIILKNSNIKNITSSQKGFTLVCNEDLIGAKIIINCAGLFAIGLREKLGLIDYSNRYVKGNYLKLTKKLAINRLIYPIPPDHGLGLGVHLTLDNQGDQKFGPNTEETETIDYSMKESLIDELFEPIHEIFYNVKKSDLQLAYCGIRPKVCDKNKKLINDFIFNTPKEHSINNYFELLGIESPGLTSAPAIAKMVVESMRL
ncbi:MAG: FAD-dependent oxidoreductase [Bacteriovorax sp.]|jgi:L-2-hydroxyglutarate oxidase LhgO